MISYPIRGGCICYRCRCSCSFPLLLGRALNTCNSPPAGLIATRTFDNLSVFQRLELFSPLCFFFFFFFLLFSFFFLLLLLLHSVRSALFLIYFLLHTLSCVRLFFFLGGSCCSLLSCLLVRSLCTALWCANFLVSYLLSYY